MRRYAICLLLALCLLAEPWLSQARGEGDAIYGCREDRAECLLLQMALAGGFDAYDPDDDLNQRVLACVYPRLCAVSDEDIRHCAAEQERAEAEVRLALYRALRNALWADLVCDRAPGGRMDGAGRILLLFIDPTSQEDADYQMAQIRRNMTEAALEALAESANTSPAFVEWLIGEG